MNACISAAALVPAQLPARDPRLRDHEDVSGRGRYDKTLAELDLDRQRLLGITAAGRLRIR
jgi:hypothetical protein